MINFTNCPSINHRQHQHHRVYYVSEEINLAVRLIPLLLHSLGLYLLHVLRKQKRHVTHLKLIQQLSISELCLVSTSVAISVLLIAVTSKVDPHNTATLERNITSIIESNSNFVVAKRDVAVPDANETVKLFSFKVFDNTPTTKPKNNTLYNVTNFDRNASRIEILFNVYNNKDKQQNCSLLHDNDTQKSTTAIGSREGFSHIPPDWELTIFILTILKNTGFSFVYYCISILITVDRFMEMRLNIRYPQIVSQRAVNVTLAGVWLFGATFTSVFMYLGRTYDDFEHITFSYLYFFSIMEILYLCTALVTYSYILKEYVRMSSILHSMPRRNQIDMLKSVKQPTSGGGGSINKRNTGMFSKLSRKEKKSTKMSEISNDKIIIDNGVKNCTFRMQEGQSVELADQQIQKLQTIEGDVLDGLNGDTRPAQDNTNNNGNSNRDHSSKASRVARYKVRSLFKRSSPLMMISLLVATFVFFMMLPDILNVVYYVELSSNTKHDESQDTENIQQPWSLVLSTYILYTLAYTSDALIYIMLQKDTRRILRRKLLQCRSSAGLRFSESTIS